ncbi:MAG: hypothetical protein M1831_005964 [Alyxoria varia]|nr:MAG: hypothetical protein M1831_005964 [Alyxoria varia]
MSSHSTENTSSSSSSEEDEEEEEDEDEEEEEEEEEGQEGQTSTQNQSATRSYQLAITLPSASPFSTRTHLHLTLYSHALVLFLAGGPGSAATSLSLPELNPQTATTSNPSANEESTVQQPGNQGEGAAGAAGASLQSFVYAMPQPAKDGVKQQPISTPLYGHPLTVDLATRVARALAGRCGRPCYVGVSGEVAGTETSGSEGLEMVRSVVEVVGKAVAR